MEGLCCENTSGGPFCPLSLRHPVKNITLFTSDHYKIFFAEIDDVSLRKLFVTN